MKPKRNQIIIPAGLHPWPHEMRVAEILALAGHQVEFLPENFTKTADILLDGIKFEIKSPRTDKINTLEHRIKDALRQSPNIIIDASRIDGRKFSSPKLQSFLISQVKQSKQVRKMLLITKDKKIIDIKSLA